MATYGGASKASQSTQKNSLREGSSTNSPIRASAQRLKASQIPPGKLTVPQKDLLVFFRQLSVVLQSGVALAQGLVLIAENMTNQKLAACVLRIARRLNAGDELSECLKEYPKVFAPITIGLIEAGETGGILDEVLDRIAQLLEDQAKIRGQIIGALVYPALVFILAITISLALLIFIVPKFKTMFDGMGAELPALTSFMLMLSNAVTSPWFAIGAPITVFAGIYLFRSIYSTSAGRLTIDRNIFKIPLFGDLILRSEMASMCDTMATLVNAGIPIVEGLDRCVSASSNELIRRTITRGINLVIQGQELNYALSSGKVFPKLVVSMIKIGEETGQLSFMLEKLAVFYKREVESTVSALTKAMEPAVIFVVAAIVGTIVISLYLPMFSLITNMGN